MNSPNDPATGDGLAERMLHSEEAAFEQFAVRYGPRLRAYFLYRGMPQTEADDAAASCVTDIAMEINRFVSRGPGSFDRWVFSCAHKSFVDWHRKAGPVWARPTHIPIDGVRNLISAENEPDSAVSEVVDEAVASLSARDQDLIKLWFYEERSYAEIGELMGMSESTARVLFHGALRRLRIVLEASPVFQALARRQPCGV